MKRTTLKLDESVLRRLKQQAAAEGQTLQDLANQLLRRALAMQDINRTPWSSGDGRRRYNPGSIFSIETRCSTC